VGLRATAGRFDAAKGGSTVTGSRRHAVSSSPVRGPWAAGSSDGKPGGMPGGAEDFTERHVFTARLVARTLRRSGLLPAAAVVVALGKACPFSVEN